MLATPRSFFALLCALLLSCQSSPRVSSPFKLPPQLNRPESPFVMVQGVQFQQRDKPYYAIGTNFELDSFMRDQQSGEPTELAHELDILKGNGINNLRVSLISSSISSVGSDKSGGPAIIAYDQSLLSNLDTLLNEAGKREITLVLILSLPGVWWLPDELGAGPNTSIAVDLPANINQTLPSANSAAFYRSDAGQSRYHALLRSLLTRINGINGRGYSDDPTIMAWQIANPLSPTNGLYDRPYFSLYRSWIENTANFIKSLDPHHLVSVASDGAMSCLQSIDLYRDTLAISEVDYLTVHLWPSTWGWFDLANSEDSYRPAVVTSKAYLLQHLLAAKSLHKPLVLDEFGFDRDNDRVGSGTGTLQRDRYFAEIFGFIEQQAELGAPLSGSNFWMWGGSRQAKDLMLRKAELVAGDPYFNQHFLNTVFEADQSTLKEVAGHAHVMGAL